MAQQTSFAHADAPRRRALNPWSADPLRPPARAHTMERLTAWFNGTLALTRAEAHALLEEAVDSGQLTHNKAEFVAAVKALAAGPKSWPDMGYRLLPDG